MKRLHPALLLSLFCLPSAALASAGAGSQAVSRPPWQINAILRTLNPSLPHNVSKLQLGPAIRLEYSFPKYFYDYIQIDRYRHDIIGGSNLFGITTVTGWVSPFLEGEFEWSPGDHGMTTQLDYDTGLSFLVNHFFQPYIEFDNFFKQSFGVEVSCVFNLSQNWQFETNFTQEIKEKTNAVYVRLGYDF